jgi:hypothetical protein
VKQLLKLKGSIFQTSVANDPMQLSTLDLWVFLITFSICDFETYLQHLCRSNVQAPITPELEATVGLEQLSPTLSMPEPTVGSTSYTEEPTQLSTLDPWVLVCLNLFQKMNIYLPSVSAALIRHRH